MSEVRTLFDIAFDYYVENKDQIHRFYRLNNDIKNKIMQRECSDIVARGIAMRNTDVSQLRYDQVLILEDKDMDGYMTPSHPDYISLLLLSYLAGGNYEIDHGVEDY